MSARKFRLLKYFIARRGDAITRELLLDDGWGHNNYSINRSVDKHIARLSRNIEAKPAETQYITTIYRVGYKFLG